MSKRFKAGNAALIVSYLKVSGLDENATLGQPSSQLNFGCGDPNCCEQHPGTIQGKPALEVCTKIGTKKLHSIAVELGLVKS
jgi:hypothetical protein